MEPDHRRGEALASPPAPPTPPDSPEPPHRRAPHRDLALVSGFPDAVRILRDWVRRPLPVVGPWLLVSLGVALLLLSLVWLVGSIVDPDPARPLGLPGRPLSDPDAAFRHVLQRNLVVLALHATACLAGFIIFFATREPAGEHEDRLERVTRATARVAFWFVPTATVLSIATQAWVLGSYASTISEHLHITVATLLRSTLWHAIPELTGVFLPLAAWLVALRRRRLGELYAATIASVLIALPMLGAAAWSEVHRWGDRVNAAPRQLPALDGVSVGELVGEDLAEPLVELRLGRRVDVPPIVEEAVALARARDRTRSGGAIAVVQLGSVHVLHELEQRDRGSDVCGGAPGPSRPISAPDIGALQFLRVATTMPGTVAELDVEQVVADGAPANPGVAPGILRSIIADRCRGDAPAG